MTQINPNAPAKPTLGPSSRCAIYERVAAGSVTRDQADACRRYVEGRGGEVISVFEDDGHSGNTLERPGLTALRNAAKRGEFGHVVVSSANRLSRNMSDLRSLIVELRSAGVSVWPVSK